MNNFFVKFKYFIRSLAFRLNPFISCTILLATCTICIWWPFAGFDTYLVQLLLVVTGGFYFWNMILKNDQASMVKLIKRTGLIYMIAIATGILIMVYLLSGISQWYMISTVCAFFLPCIVKDAWKAFNNMDMDAPKIWYGSEEESQVTLPVTGRSLTIPIVLRIIQHSIHFQEYPIMLPADFRLGTLFYFSARQINEDEEEKIIQLNGGNGLLFGWSFHVLYLNGSVKKYLDPAKTLTENNIRRNKVIIVKREASTHQL